MSKKLFSLLIAILTLVITPTAVAFIDVSERNDYLTAIEFLKEEGIAQGYQDGSYRPKNPINRAEFTKLLVESKLGENPLSYSANCFSDVSENAWYSSYICYAKENGLIKGYRDGSFKPENELNLVEAATILSNTFELEANNPIGDDWFSPFIEAIGQNHYIPPSFNYLGQRVNRAEMAELVWRVSQDVKNQDFKPSNHLLPGSCQDLGEDLPDNIDMDRVRNTWNTWTNEVRTNMGLHPYIYNSQLDRSATVWSEVSKDRGYIDHKRWGSTAYYDYPRITQWFSDLGLVFENVNRATHTENIGYGRYECSPDEADCTDYLIGRMRNIFDFFMSEKGQAYDPHYRSIVQKYFREIGLGISVDLGRNKYYLTVHYGTNIISNPEPVCNG